MQGPSISVVTVSYNSAEFLGSCLAALCQDEEPPEVIVVDNASTDDTVCLLTSGCLKQLPIKLISMDSNVGFAAACNVGAGSASAEYVIFLNPDAVVSPGSLRVLTGVLEAFPDVGIVGPRIVSPSGEVEPSWDTARSLGHTVAEAFGLYALSRAARHRKLGIGSGRAEAVQDAGWVSGACLAIRAALFDELGGFDTEFFMYAEDVDLCLRAQKVGYRVAYVPMAQVVHLGGGSSAKVRSFALLQGYRSHMYYWRKHGGPLGWRVLRPLFSIASSLKAAASASLSLLGNADYRPIMRAHAAAALRVWSRNVASLPVKPDSARLAGSEGDR